MSDGDVIDITTVALWVLGVTRTSPFFTYLSLMVLIACKNADLPQETPETHYQAACLVNANPDAVSDVLSVASNAGTSMLLLDGVNGAKIWENNRVLPEYSVHCISESLFAVDMGNGQVNIVNAKSPDKVTPVLLTGQLVSVEQGEQCLTLLNDKNTKIGFDLRTKKITQCESQDGANQQTQTTQKIDGRVYTVESKEQQRFVVSEKNNVVWSKNLTYRTEDAFVVANETIVLVGLDEKKHQTLVGLDAQNGSQLYALSIREDVVLTGYNGRYMIVQWGKSIRAVDVATGKSIWKRGGENGD